MAINADRLKAVFDAQQLQHQAQLEATTKFFETIIAKILDQVTRGSGPIPSPIDCNFKAYVERLECKANCPRRLSVPDELV
jgi:hypothetical protein